MNSLKWNAEYVEKLLANFSRISPTRSGSRFDATAANWQYRDGVQQIAIKFDRLGPCSDRMLFAIKRLFVVLIETYAASSINYYFTCVVNFIRWLNENHKKDLLICGHHFLNFANARPSNANHLRTALLKWGELGLPCIASNLVPTLKAFKSVRRTTTGSAVLTMDAKEGPFTDIEFGALQEEINNAYVDGSLRTHLYIAFWIFAATGARPSQLALMKVRDVILIETNGIKSYSIDVPSAKKRKSLRGRLVNRPLVTPIGDLVYKYTQTVRAAFREVNINPLNAPLFPITFSRVGFSRGFEYHPTAAALGGEIADALSKLRVVSERTGAPMRVTPIRFRRTFGTRAAQEGHGVLVIAELLDHADTQYAGIYVQSRPDIAIRIDKSVATALAPLAQAFAGKVIANEGEASLGKDNSRRIRDFRVSPEPLASCGQQAFCGSPAPLACYTCASFEPWADAPHEAVLEALIAKRQIEASHGSARIATIHDRTIIAVAEVVALCKAYRDEQKEGGQL